MRPSPTRPVGCPTRVLFAAPFLVICVACATPFPFEHARQEFGPPEAIETRPGSARSSWTYLHDELDPFPLVFGPMPLRVAVASIQTIMQPSRSRDSGYTHDAKWQQRQEWIREQGRRSEAIEPYRQNRQRIQYIKHRRQQELRSECE